LERTSTVFDLGLIMPCYNYEAGLRRSLERIAAWRQRSGLRVALCIADDGSTDSSSQIAQEFQLQYPDWCFLQLGEANRGKGYAVREGSRRLDTNIPYLFFTDTDLHYGLDVISDRMLPALNAGADVVLLDRSWNKQFHAQSLLRKLLSYSFIHLKTILAGVPLEDSQAGMKGFRGDFFRTAVSIARVNGFAFDVEILSLAIQYRCRIDQIPIRIRGEHEVEGSSMTPRKAVRMFWDLLVVGARRFAGRYQSEEFNRRISAQIYEIKKNEF
jgi:dolichyl-phosphate beta-glucosyltransferase